MSDAGRRQHVARRPHGPGAAPRLSCRNKRRDRRRAAAPQDDAPKPAACLASKGHLFSSILDGPAMIGQARPSPPAFHFLCSAPGRAAGPILHSYGDASTALAMWSPQKAAQSTNELTDSLNGNPHHRSGRIVLGNSALTAVSNSLFRCNYSLKGLKKFPGVHPKSETRKIRDSSP